MLLNVNAHTHVCHSDVNMHVKVPYMAKPSSGKTFVVFELIAKVFPLNNLLCTVYDGHGLMHRESFPVNSVFCTQP